MANTKKGRFLTLSAVIGIGKAFGQHHRMRNSLLGAFHTEVLKDEVEYLLLVVVERHHVSIKLMNRLIVILFYIHSSRDQSTCVFSWNRIASMFCISFPICVGGVAIDSASFLLRSLRGFAM